MNLASIESNASNLPKPHTCSTRSSSRATADALQPCSPISTSMHGPIIWETLRWLWLSSTVSSKAQSSSRSKENPIAPPKLKPPPPQITNAPNLSRLLDRFRLTPSSSQPPRWSYLSRQSGPVFLRHRHYYYYPTAEK